MINTVDLRLRLSRMDIPADKRERLEGMLTDIEELAELRLTPNVSRRTKMVCKLFIPGTVIACGETGNFCSEECELLAQVVDLQLQVKAYKEVLLQSGLLPRAEQVFKDKKEMRAL